MVQQNKIDNNLPDQLEMSKYLWPSEFVSKICSLDISSNTVKVWSAATGDLINETPIMD